MLMSGGTKSELYKRLRRGTHREPEHALSERISPAATLE